MLYGQDDPVFYSFLNNFLDLFKNNYFSKYISKITKYCLQKYLDML